MSATAAIFFFSATLVSAQQGGASEVSQTSDPAVRCETAYLDDNGSTIQKTIYIAFPSSNISGDNGIFFGGSKLYFLNGEVRSAVFLMDSPDLNSYSREDFENRNVVLLKEGYYSLAASNVEADKPKASFDLRIRPSGLALPRIEGWKGACRQISISEDAAFRELQSKEVANK